MTRRDEDISQKLRAGLDALKNLTEDTHKTIRKMEKQHKEISKRAKKITADLTSLSELVAMDFREWLEKRRK